MRKMIFSTLPFDYFEQHRSGALYDKETYFLNFINSAYHYALLLGVFGLAIGLVIVGYFFPFGTNKTLGEAKKKLSSLIVTGIMLFSIASIAEIIMQIVANTMKGLHF